MSDDDREELLGEAAEEFRQSEDTESSGGKKALLLILGPILLAGGGAGIYFSGILDEKAEETAQPKEIVSPVPQKSIYFDLPEMLVNLNSVGPRPSFLKLRASLELEKGTDTLLLTILKSRIIDKFQVYVRELRLNDLRANGGLIRLQEELRAEINKAVSPVKIKHVLFRNRLVQ